MEGHQCTVKLHPPPHTCTFHIHRWGDGLWGGGVRVGRDGEEELERKLNISFPLLPHLYLMPLCHLSVQDVWLWSATFLLSSATIGWLVVLPCLKALLGGRHPVAVTIYAIIGRQHTVSTHTHTHTHTHTAHSQHTHTHCIIKLDLFCIYY